MATKRNVGEQPFLSLSSLLIFTLDPRTLPIARGGPMLSCQRKELLTKLGLFHSTSVVELDAQLECGEEVLLSVQRLGGKAHSQGVGLINDWCTTVLSKLSRGAHGANPEHAANAARWMGEPRLWDLLRDSARIVAHQHRLARTSWSLPQSTLVSIISAAITTARDAPPDAASSSADAVELLLREASPHLTLSLDTSASLLESALLKLDCSQGNRCERLLVCLMQIHTQCTTAATNPKRAFSGFCSTLLGPVSSLLHSAADGELRAEASKLLSASLFREDHLAGYQSAFARTPKAAAESTQLAGKQKKRKSKGRKKQGKGGDKEEGAAAAEDGEASGSEVHAYQQQLFSKLQQLGTGSSERHIEAVWSVLPLLLQDFITATNGQLARAAAAMEAEHEAAVEEGQGKPEITAARSRKRPRSALTPAQDGVNSRAGVKVRAQQFKFWVAMTELLTSEAVDGVQLKARLTAGRDLLQLLLMRDVYRVFEDAKALELAELEKLVVWLLKACQDSSDADADAAVTVLESLSLLVELNPSLLEGKLTPALQLAWVWASEEASVPAAAAAAAVEGFVLQLVTTHARLRQMDRLLGALLEAADAGEQPRPSGAMLVLGKEAVRGAVSAAFAGLPQGQLADIWGVLSAHLQGKLSEGAPVEVLLLTCFIQNVHVTSHTASIVQPLAKEMSEKIYLPVLEQIEGADDSRLATLLPVLGLHGWLIDLHTRCQFWATVNISNSSSTSQEEGTSSLCSNEAGQAVTSSVIRSLLKRVDEPELLQVLQLLAVHRIQEMYALKYQAKGEQNGKPEAEERGGVERALLLEQEQETAEMVQLACELADQHEEGWAVMLPYLPVWVESADREHVLSFLEWLLMRSAKCVSGAEPSQGDEAGLAAMTDTSFYELEPIADNFCFALLRLLAAQVPSVAAAAAATGLDHGLDGCSSTKEVIKVLERATAARAKRKPAGDPGKDERELTTCGLLHLLTAVPEGFLSSQDRLLTLRALLVLHELCSGGVAVAVRSALAVAGSCCTGQGESQVFGGGLLQLCRALIFSGSEAVTRAVGVAEMATLCLSSEQSSGAVGEAAGMALQAMNGGGDTAESAQAVLHALLLGMLTVDAEESSKTSRADAVQAVVKEVADACLAMDMPEASHMQQLLGSDVLLLSGVEPCPASLRWLSSLIAHLAARAVGTPSTGYIVLLSSICRSGLLQQNGGSAFTEVADMFAACTNLSFVQDHGVGMAWCCLVLAADEEQIARMVEQALTRLKAGGAGAEVACRLVGMLAAAGKGAAFSAAMSACVGDVVAVLCCTMQTFPSPVSSIVALGAVLGRQRFGKVGARELALVVGSLSTSVSLAVAKLSEAEPGCLSQAEAAVEVCIEQVCRLARTLLRLYARKLYLSLPAFSTLLRSLLVAHFGLLVVSGKEGSSGVCAESGFALVRLMEALPQHKDAMRSFLPYLVVDYVKLTLDRRNNAQDLLLPGIYSLLSTLGQFELQQVHGFLGSNGKAIFRGLYSEFEREFKYSGNV